MNMTCFMNDIARLTSAFRLAWLALAGTVAVGCTPSVTNEPPPQTTSPPAVVQAADVKLAVPPAIDDATAKALADFNRGAALVEQYKYSDAAEAFRSALKLKPGWTAAKFNLGIACFNMHGQREAEESLESARRAFEEVLAAEPKNLRAVFCLGLYYQYLGENEKALERFKTVYEADDQDPYAA